jgi:hypothetical protein
LDKAYFYAANHTLDIKLDRLTNSLCVNTRDTGDTMLAEIFMLRLEAISRPTKDLIPSFGRFVPLNPVASSELTDKSRNRRS